MNLTPAQQAQKHHNLLPLEVWSVYNNPVQQAEYDLARFELSRRTPEAQAVQATNPTAGWALAFLASLLIWALLAVAFVQAVTFVQGTI